MYYSRRTISTPTLLHFHFPHGHINRNPNYIDTNFYFEGIQYELVGVSYGNGGHFHDRLFFEGKAWLADGMKEISGVKQAITYEISGRVETAFPKQDKEPIICTDSQSNKRNRSASSSTYSINDILYLKCSPTWDEG